MKRNSSLVKKIGLAVALIAISAGGFAQEKQTKHGWMTNKFFDNWFISIGAGAQVFEGQQDQKGDFGDRITPAFDAAIGKWFTPSVGARFQVGGFKAKGFADETGRYITGTPNEDGFYTERFNIMNYHGDFLLNFNNAVAGWKEHRVWNLIPFVGFGIVDVSKKGYPDRTDFAAHVGMINRFRVSHRLDIDLEFKQMLAKDELDGATWGSSKVDGMSTLTLGLNFKLGKTGWSKGLSQSDLDNAVAANTAAYKSRVSNLERDLASEKSTNERYKTEIERLRNQPAKVEVKESILAQPLAIFFNINSAQISQKEKINLKYAADVIKESDAKYKVTGYADDKTGTVQYNDKLAVKRAQNVYNILVNEYGVSADQIEVVERASGEVVFNNAQTDRVAIVKSK